MGRIAVSITAVLICLACAAPALAAAPLGLDDCVEVEGTRACSGLVPTWDGVPLDTTVTIPPGATRPLPLLVNMHGFGNSKHEYLNPADTAYTDNAFAWARDGYAVLTFTSRGLWGSCGTPEARLASPVACASGHLHLADVRYEVRDAQELIGKLVDDGTVDPGRIGVTGDSYGGGQALMLAALRDRVMQPDGTLVPWRSPEGRALRLAAAAPVIPWSHLVATIAPNGRTLVGEDVPLRSLVEPVGVFKPSVANAILAAAQNATGPGQPVGEPFIPGRPMGFVAPGGTDPQADVFGWVARSDLGEPYTDPGARSIIDLLTRYHSAITIDPTSPPPPLFVGSGFNDDLFPVDETLRFTEQVNRLHPRVPVSVLLGDFGHQRSSNKRDVRALLLRRIHAWMDHHLRGEGPAPKTGVEAMTQTCPRERVSEGPFLATNAAALADRHVRLRASNRQTVTSAGGSPAASLQTDPVAGGGDGCVEVTAGRVPGTAVYDLAPAPAGGTLLLGAPRVTARLRVHGAPPSVSQIQAHLWDLAPGGTTQRLVARGTLRPSGGAKDVFELHANGWRFEKGHVARLELAGIDAPFGRPSNAVFSIDVDELELDLPVRDAGPTRAPTTCASRRLLTVHLPLRSRERLRTATVRIGARAARRARVIGRRGVRVDLRGLPRARHRVRVSAVTRSGRRVVATRRLRTCTARR